MVFPDVVVEPLVDYWNIEWKIEDETIAKCTPETGIETYHGIGTAGRATIQGLKAGNTNLLVKVKIAENQFKEFSVPITINETKKDEPREDKKEEPKKDNTITDKNLPNTGENNFIIISTIAVILTVSIYLGIKMKKKRQN